ncbi:sensor histidine kinase [Vallitalea sp.]|uniref:sensor histidine kinase n=1 Tax=Vallitalea sp. TaxID=1882829 RepID=UPI0025F1378D|nr:sensor histidine kinase [Vallitalea sp.]MCT4687268.1 sensor histidine kinase [Vallitalea sp.]
MKNLIVKLIDRYNLKSIQVLITFSFSILIFFIICTIAFLSYHITGTVVEENTNEYVYQLVKQVNNDIDYYLRTVETIAENIRYNNDLNEYVRTENQELEKDIISDLNTYVESRNDIINIVFISNKGRVFHNNLHLKLKDNINFEDFEWYRKAKNEEKFVVSESHIQRLFESRYKWVVSCSTLLKSPYYEENLGVLLVDINYNLIIDMVSSIKLGQKGYVFIVDNNGDIVYHPKQQLLYSGLKSEDMDTILNSEDGTKTVIEDRKKKQYTITTSKYSGWKVVSSVYMEDILSYKPNLDRFFFIMGTLAIFISIFISVLISRSILYPIKKLVNTMHQVEEGNLDVSIDIKNDNEIGELAKAFNLMTNRINNLVNQNKKVEKNKRKNELRALQAQINPHFLYNTLDSIIWMAESKNYKGVVIMTSALAKLFRISISKGAQYITVAEEIEHVENYLKIQKIRYGDHLDYHIDVEEDIKQNKIIKLIIQPIVENAIYHGIKNVHGGGMIDISVKKYDNKILITIADDGVGMSQQEIKLLFSKNQELPKEKKLGGVGVRNVDNRIKLYYGEDYGLEIESEIYEGTTVKAWLPNISILGGDNI